MEAQRVVWYGSMLGVAFGAFTWVVVAGNLIHEPLVSFAGALVAAGTWWVGGRALIANPLRRRLVFGIVILFVVLADWLFLGFVLPRIPQGGSIYLGTSRSAYAALQPILLVGGLTGTGLIVWDLLLARR
jgi:hypothetical protein